VFFFVFIDPAPDVFLDLFYAPRPPVTRAQNLGALLLHGCLSNVPSEARLPHWKAAAAWSNPRPQQDWNGITRMVERPHRNFYGRRKGKQLKASQERYLEEDLAALSPGPVDWDVNPQRRKLDLDRLFAGAPVWLEIGFGGGEHMVHQAGRNRDVGIIGCEPFINGVAMLLGKIRKAGVDNLRVYPGDARDLFDVLPDASVSKCFLLYPDPWPKARHHRRRFVTPEHLEPLRRVMRPGAELRVATDIPDYVRQTLAQVPRHGFEWQAERPNDWRQPWEDWLPTRYEQKALREGRKPHYLTFFRL
jgi:tRNA (guanine-N7-)-methyltransferase